MNKSDVNEILYEVENLSCVQFMALARGAADFDKELAKKLENAAEAVSAVKQHVRDRMDR